MWNMLVRVCKIGCLGKKVSLWCWKVILLLLKIWYWFSSQYQTNTNMLLVYCVNFLVSTILVKHTCVVSWISSW
jgi:hypothetical protein